MILIVGCSNNEVLENSTDLKDENYSVRKIAWDFLHKKVGMTQRIKTGKLR